MSTFKYVASLIASAADRGCDVPAPYFFFFFFFFYSKYSLLYFFF
jgi:hypothetical protein